MMGIGRLLHENCKFQGNFRGGDVLSSLRSTFLSTSTSRHIYTSARPICTNYGKIPISCFIFVLRRQGLGYSECMEFPHNTQLLFGLTSYTWRNYVGSFRIRWGADQMVKHDHIGFCFNNFFKKLGLNTSISYIPLFHKWQCKSKI